MKKIIALTLALVMVLGLCACAGVGGGDKGDAVGSYLIFIFVCQRERKLGFAREHQHFDVFELCEALFGFSADG